MKKITSISMTAALTVAALTPAIGLAAENHQVAESENAPAGFYNVKTGAVVSINSFLFLSSPEKLSILLNQHNYFIYGDGNVLKTTVILEAVDDDMLEEAVALETDVENQFNVEFTASGKVLFLSPDDLSNALENVISDAKDLLETLPEDRQQELLDAIDKAELVLNNPDASIEDLQNALDQLNDTIKNIDTNDKHADQALEDAKNSIPEDLSGYSDESLQALLDAQKLPENSVEEKLAKAEAINNAVAGLNDKTEATKDALEDAINGAKDKLENLPEDQQQAVEDAIKNAEDVLNNPDASAEDLQNALEDLNNAIDNSAKDPAVKAAEDAVKQALETKNEKDVENAQDLVNELKGGKVKEELQEQIDKIKADINAFVKAEDALNQAVNDRTLEALDKASDLVENLPEDTDTEKEKKQVLLEKLKEIEVMLAEDLAVAAVEKAEVSKRQSDFNIAQRLVNSLNEGEMKKELQKRLNNIDLETLNLTNLKHEINDTEKILDLHANNYTPESVKIVREALQAAKDVYKQFEGQEDVTNDAQKTITLATEALRDAVSKLVEADIPVFAHTEETRKTAELFLNPVPNKLNDREKTSGGVLGLDIGILDLGLLSASQLNQISEKNRHSLKVEQGKTIEATATVAIHSVLGGRAFKIHVMKENADGDFVRIATHSGSSGSFLGIAKTATIDLDLLDEGNYELILDVGAGIAVVEVIPYKLVNMVEYNYTKVATAESKVTGNVLKGQKLGAQDKAIISDIRVKNDKTSTEITTDGIVLQGKYGQLHVEQNGTYEYYPASVRKNVGQVEVFEYTIRNTHNKQTAVGTLEIRLNDESVQWNDNNWTDEAKIVVAKNARTSIKAEPVKTSTNEVSGKNASAIVNNKDVVTDLFKVQDKASTLNFMVHTTGSTVPGATVKVVSKDGEVVDQKTDVNLTSTKQDFTFMNLDAGEYKIVIDQKHTAPFYPTVYIQNIKVISQTWGNYQLGKIESATGNFKNIEGNFFSNTPAKTDIFVEGYSYDDNRVTSIVKSFYKVDERTVIAGDHGVLTIETDGKYTYVPNQNMSSIGQKDVFKYKLSHLSGNQAEATLTFEIPALLQSSQGDDVLVGSTAPDTIKGNSGSDTLVYSVVGQDGTGGNNHDTWTDFHYGTIATDRDADRIDLRELFTVVKETDKGLETVKHEITEANLNTYLKVTTSGKNITLQIDRDGVDGQYKHTNLITLNAGNLPAGEKVTLEKLIQNGQLILDIQP